MGNQQERSLSWLGGIIDGEGSVTVQVYMMPDGRVRLTPFIAIINQDSGIIEECKRIMSELGFKMRWHDRGDGCFNGRLDGEKPVYEFASIIKEYLHSFKRKNCEVIMRFMEMRRSNRFTRDSIGRIRRNGYTREEVELVSTIRTHHRAKSSEAICQAPNVIG